MSGELVASMAPGCVVMLVELGRVPSDPWLGRTATPGPAPCYSTITSQLLVARAGCDLCVPMSHVLRFVHLTTFVSPAWGVGVAGVGAVFQPYALSSNELQA